MEYFAPWFRRQMARREWKQADFARRSGVSARTVSAWFRGDRLPDPQSCDIIADAFGVPLDEVLRIAGHRPANEQSPDDELRDRLKAMIDGIAAPYLLAIESMLQGPYDASQRTRIRVIEGRRTAEEKRRYKP